MPAFRSSGLIDVLKIAPFRYLWLAQVISQTAANMLTFVLGVVLYADTRSNSAVSALYLTVGLPAVVFGIFSGVFVDRANKRRLLIISTLVRIVLVAFILLTRSNQLLVLTVMFFVAIASLVFVPAEAALIPRFVPGKLLLSANALFTLTFYSAIVSGYVAGGPLLAVLGEDKLIIVLIALFLVTGILLFFLPKEPLPLVKRVSLTQVWSDVGEVISFIRRSTILVHALFLLIMAQAVIAIFVTLGPGFADQILAIRLTDASVVILAPAAAGMIVGTGLVGSLGQRFRKRTLINTGILLSGSLLVFVSLLVRTTHGQVRLVFEYIFTESFAAGILPLSMISFFFLGVANSLIDISCNTVLQERTTEQMRGRVYGILSSLVAGVAVIPVVVSGILADLFGIQKIIFFLGLLLFVFGVFTSHLSYGWGRNSSD